MGYKQKGWSAFTKKKDKKNGGMAEGNELSGKDEFLQNKKTVATSIIDKPEERVEHVNVPSFYEKTHAPIVERRLSELNVETKPEKKVNKRKVVKTVIKNKPEKKSKRRYADGGIETNKLWWEREKR